MSRTIPKPLFAGSSFSGENRMVAPFDPPVFVVLSYVPEECHACRTAIGNAITFAFNSASCTSLQRVFVVVVVVVVIVVGLHNYSCVCAS